MNSQSQRGSRGGMRNGNGTGSGTGWGSGRSRGDGISSSSEATGHSGRSNGTGTNSQSYRGAHNSSRYSNNSNRGSRSNYNSNGNHHFQESNEQGRKTNMLGYRKFTEFLGMQNDDVIAALDKNSKNFIETISKAEITNDFVTLLVQVIGEKVCGDTSLAETRNSLIAVVADPVFLKRLQTFTLSLMVPTSGSGTSNDRSRQGNNSNTALEFVLDTSPLRILNGMCDLYAFVCAKMQNLAADHLPENIMAAQVTLTLLISRNHLPQDSLPVQNLQQRFKKLEVEVMEFKTLKEQKEFSNANKAERQQHFTRGKLTESDLERLYLMKPEDEFTKMSIVPSTEEILADEEPFLRPNLVKGRYPSALTYLDVQFRLLREDFVAPLRESVKEWVHNESAYLNKKKKLPPGTIRFYNDVRLKKVECLQEITIYSMQFSTANLKRVKWEKSKRLLGGSLVLLTSDKFQSMYFATVYRRDERQLANGIVNVVWEGRRPDTYTDVTFLMVECEVYFESYRHTLKALQFMARPGPPHYEVPLLQTYRMAKYIVDMSTEEVPAPLYLRTTKRRMDFSMVLACNAENVELMSQMSVPEVVEAEGLSAWRNGSPSTSPTPTSPDRGLGIVQSLQRRRQEALASKLKPHDANALSLDEWPTAKDLGMDEPQYLAFQSAITHELSIIQGPPGTGKTYIGLQIIKLFLSNPLIVWGTPDTEPKEPDSPENSPAVEVPTPVPIPRISSVLKSIESRRRAHMLHKSPILIVCYTNHALDQFLEGILSIMKSLGIETLGNLIRVGGRSKVEALEEYSIKVQRDRYRQLRMFDPTYAELRGRTTAHLKNLQITRAGLKDVYKGLGNTTGNFGIVNFLRLVKILQEIYSDWSNRGGSEISKWIPTVMPPELQVYFFGTGQKLLTWLGLNINNIFNTEPFNSNNLLRQWFGAVRQSDNPWRKHNDDENMAARNGNVENRDNIEDEQELEDFGLKEIMEANRLEEEISMESNDCAQREKIFIPYVHLSPVNFRSEFFQLEKEYQDAYEKGNQRQIKQIECRYYSLQTLEAKWKNQMRFLGDLLTGVKEGRIELPVVNPELLKRAHFTDAKSHPSLCEKWAIYFHVIGLFQKFLLTDIMKTEAQIIGAQERLAEVNNRGDGLILQEAKIVGLTTTGAAKYNTLLRMMKSRIVIVEEAAEVLESHIVTSITEHCEHLILIGDHQQLRPSTTVYKLAKDYNLDVSLFERLINNKLSWHYLKAQHRMRPEICKLLVPSIYEDLENYPNVLLYPKVLGLAKDLFFITHNEHEKADNDSMTKSNEYEARFLTKLCRYIMLQGYHASQITILVTYIGQMFLVKKLITEEGGTCRGVRVTVVDNFQGEENDIILLSLVRSNEDNKVGFLKTDNRICVALSRAKHGMYVIGNMDCLLKSKSKTWARINDEFHDQECIGKELKLKCQIHGDIIPIGSPDDFQRKCPEGGCAKECPGILPRCSHSCRLICHVADKNHEEYQCKFVCEKTCSKPEKHPCRHPCFKPCSPCTVLMMRELPCSHVNYLYCHVDHLTWRCTETVTKELDCGHVKDLECYFPVSQYTCEERVPKTLDCGHVKVLPCSVPISEWECVEEVEKNLSCGHSSLMLCNDDPESFTCLALTDKLLPCGHQQDVRCSQDIMSVDCITVLKKTMPDCEHAVSVFCCQANSPEVWVCQSRCDTRLDCGHECNQKCHSKNDPDHEYYVCKKQCSRECEGKHPCTTKHSCYQPCSPCQVRTDKTLPCGHILNNVTCSVDPDKWKCSQPCQRTLDQADCPFEHQCTKKCFENCAPCITAVDKIAIDCGHPMKVPCHIEANKSICEELVPAPVKSLCGHSVEVPCKIQSTCTAEECLKYCHQPCGHIVPKEKGGCGHPCQGDCSSCFQGRIHIKCQEKCERVLACGHICKHPCSMRCPPCEEKCMLVCKHSKCKKTCGTPCAGCKERCKWACEHMKCTRKCSEICNREACDEPCKKKLKSCEHDCIGMCGEPCPPFCRVCDKEVVQEIFFGNEDEDDARFVFLDDCKHLVHKDSMDKWMSTEQSKGEIGVKSCPKCSKVIVQSVRYGNVLKRRMQDVVAVRDKIFGKDAEAKQRAIQHQISDQLQEKQNSAFAFESFRQHLEAMTCSYKRINNKKSDLRVKRELKKVDQYTFESLHNMVSWWDDAEKNVKLKPARPQQYPEAVRYVGGILRGPSTPVVKQDLTDECHTDLITKYNWIFQTIRARKLPLSPREIEDFDREFDRLYDLYRLYLRRGFTGFTSFRGTELMFNTIQKLLSKPQLYNEGDKNSFPSLLKQLEGLLESGWRLEERDRQGANLFKAMGFGYNHWYKCAKGHLYTVGNCGEFNQASRCPECGSNIGSGSAANRAGATEQIVRELASTMDEPAPDFSFGESSRASYQDNYPNRRGHGSGYMGRRSYY